MLLVPVDVLRGRMGFDEGLDLDEALEGQLSAATTFLEGVLRTSFDRVTQTDTFLVTLTPQIDTVFKVYLATKRGFLTGAPAVLWSTTMEGLATGEDLATYLLADREKGLIAIMGKELSNALVSVTYTAGFEDDGAGVYKDVPDWLKDAAVLKAMMTFDKANPQFRRQDSGMSDIKDLESEFKALTSRKVRYLPQALNPVV